MQNLRVSFLLLKPLYTQKPFCDVTNVYYYNDWHYLMTQAYYLFDQVRMCVSPMPCHITRGTVALFPHDEPHNNNRHPDTAMRRRAADKPILESEPEDVNTFTSLLTENTYRKGKRWNKEVNKWSCHPQLIEWAICDTLF